MIVRRLEQKEHGMTRPLWEEVFSEDTTAFLDYYYYIKARDNQIYVVEEDGKICSMLQLNPYLMKVEKSELMTAYIIAVSTKEDYRGRGFMGALLRRSLSDMYEAKLPFTFLMPAAEAIYTPYDFRFIYSQNIALPDVSSLAPGPDDTEELGGKLSFTDAVLWNAEELAAFFNRHFAGQWQVHVVRDGAYYQTMILEQQSERGGVRLIRDNGDLVGFYAYAAEDGLEIREPLYLPECEGAFLASVRDLAGDVGKVKIYASPEYMAEGKKPVIMARIVCLQEFLKAMKVREEFELDCSFAVIDPLIRQNSRVWRLTGRAGETCLNVQETEDSEGVLPVDVLTEYLFGRISIQDVSDREGVLMTGHLAEELEKITKLTEVFLNEVV